MKRVSVGLTVNWSFRRARAPGAQAAEAETGIPADDGAWLPATVPGCVHTDLFANARIADPFYGTNEREQQWIEKCGWEYRTVFSLDEAVLLRSRVELVCKGLDTYAEVVLNGVAVVSANNMFREWRVEVKPLLREQDNELCIRFRSPITEVKQAYDELGYVLPATNDQATPMVSMFTRKAPYHFGWDWGPRFVTSGIWRPVLLEAWDDGRIDDVQVLQTSLTEKRATLRVKTTVVASRGRSARVSLTVDGASAGGEVNATLVPGVNVIEADVAIDRPERWWPNGLGEPHLYDVQAALTLDRTVRDTKVVRVGLRTIEVVHRADDEGKSFTIEVNGAPVFMKGANYIPQDSFVTRVTSARYRRLLESAAAANMNMLRVWGGGIYEEDVFYDLCDELGILVWQDFMFACSMYPGDDDFVDNVRQEAVENVRRLRNHPSVALWAGNNEIEVAWARWGWQAKFQLSAGAQEEILAGYRRVFHEVLPAVVAEHDPGRFYTRSSPSANDDRVVPDTVDFGDMHYWGVWHAEEPYKKYGDNVSRFMSEYGFQSFPEMETVASYAPESEWRIDSPVMLAHQRHPRGNELIRIYMDRDFRTPKDFPSFLDMRQVLQATIIQYAAEAHRRRMPYNGGSLFWQLDDCWPVASWSGIDYFGRWKALHFFARRFFAPLLVSTVEENDAVAVYVVSDRREAVTLNLSLRLIDFEGNELWSRETEEHVEGASSRMVFAMAPAEILKGADARTVVLVVEAGKDGKRLSRSLHFFLKTKDLELPDAGLDLSARTDDTGSVTLRVRARKLARSVRLFARGSEGAFSDNYFDVLPGEVVAVDWTGAASARFEVSSIRDTF